MIDASKFTPLGRHVLLLKCVKDHVRDDKGVELVTLTDKSLANTNWLEIIAVGPKCKLVTAEHIGKVGRLPNWSHYLTKLPIKDEAAPKNEYWSVREIDDAGQPMIQFVVED